MKCTVFVDRFAQMKAEQVLDIEELQMSPPRAESKEELPLLKLARMGDKATDKGCLRSDDNVLAVTGAEIDYDEGEQTLSYARNQLEKAGIESIGYTSPSHTALKPRWRLLLPFKDEFMGTVTEMREYRAQAVKRAEEALGFPVASESYTLSQAFYYGVVNGSSYSTMTTGGKPVDVLYDLQKQEAPIADGFKAGNVNGGIESLDVQQATSGILKGEVLHENLRALSASYAQKGMPEPDIIATLKSLMDHCNEQGTNRWQQRYDDIPRLVESAIKKFAPEVEVIVAGRTVADMIKEYGVTNEDVINLKETDFIYKKDDPTRSHDCDCG